MRIRVTHVPWALIALGCLTSGAIPAHAQDRASNLLLGDDLCDDCAVSAGYDQPALAASDESSGFAFENGDVPPPADYNAKLLLTNAVSPIDGGSGGGIASWATIAGRQSDRGVGMQMHGTYVTLPDYEWTSLGVAVGIGEALRLGRGEERSGGREKPRLLASAMEAVIGAVLRDGGAPAALALVDRLFAEQARGASAERDAKSRLQEAVQSERGQTPTYRVVDTAGPDHERIFRVAVVVW